MEIMLSIESLHWNKILRSKLRSIFSHNVFALSSPEQSSGVFARCDKGAYIDLRNSFFLLK